MIHYIFEEFRTERAFAAWVRKQQKCIRDLAFENRPVIDKRSLENEIRLFATLEKAWKPMKALRRKSGDYQLLVEVDKKGYHSFVIVFPVTQEDIDRAVEHRLEVIKQLGRWGDICYSLDESVYDTLKEAVDSTLSFADRCLDDSCHRYERYHGNKLLRKSFVTSFK